MKLKVNIMNQFLNKIFLLFILFSVNILFAQDVMNSTNRSTDFKPMFLLGAGYYTFQGDIVGPETNSLVANVGYKSGIRFNVGENLDLSLTFSTNSFYESNDNLEFESDIDAIGINLGYTFSKVFDNNSVVFPYSSIGVQNLSYKTLNNDYQSGWTERKSTIAIPLSFGLRLDVSERLDFDATIGYSITMADIDKSVEKTTDNFMSINFIIHYDLFTRDKEPAEYIDGDYYVDVDFNALENEDSDGDLIIDLEDYCPKTPKGVKVDASGCPLDSDNDGIPDYIDAQKNTPKGVVVDEKGVQLTEDKFSSMYADYEAASRKYANFYNEYEIRREDYKTVDDYLIAKANAFNNTYNNNVDNDNVVPEINYMVMIGQHYESIPPVLMNKYLSLEDLHTITQEDGSVIYFVGKYTNLDDALERSYSLESNSFNETSILVSNNGNISIYSPPITHEDIDVPDTNLVIDSEVKQEDIDSDSDTFALPTDMNATVYRVQIGAFKVPLSKEIFIGVDNVISFTGNDGWIRYMTGSFIAYRNAVNYMMEMKARGFEDAFIVTYKDGERVNLDFAISSSNSSKNIQELSVEHKKDNNLDISFIVQILVTDVPLTAKDIDNMVQLGNIEKQVEGTDIVRYFIGTYNKLEQAENRLEYAKSLGYNDAFIFAKYNGERISLDDARKIIQDSKN